MTEEASGAKEQVSQPMPIAATVDEPSPDSASGGSKREEEPGTEQGDDRVEQSTEGERKEQSAELSAGAEVVDGQHEQAAQAVEDARGESVNETDKREENAGTEAAEPEEPVGERNAEGIEGDRAASQSVQRTMAEADPKEVVDEEQFESTLPQLSKNSQLDRELPAPPTPSKEPESLAEEWPVSSEPSQSLPSGEGEMAEVARAFGVELQVSEQTKKRVPPTIEVAKAEQVGASGGGLGIPVSPDPASASPKSPRTGGLKIGKGPPPTTQASEEKPFDFNRFLDQMRHKSAGPVGEYVRSFIKGFTKKPYRVSDQTKLIFDFLDFISQRMRECEVWSKLSTSEFENAIEAMEKLLMNRLYSYTFSPAVRREGKWSVQTDDLERDRVLKQRIRLFGWIGEEHLDVPMGNHSKGFLDFATEELLKMNHYKAPRDKVICILNCCKVIFGLIRHLSTEENADTFIPILIFVVLRSNPDHLISNVEYIGRFRNPERLSSESGYYLSSLMGAVAFIETMDYTSLSNITQQQFEANVEAAVEKLSAQPESVDSSPARTTLVGGVAGEAGQSMDRASGHSSAQMTPSSSSGEEAARPLPLSTGAATLAEDTKAFFQRTGEAARVGIGASIGKPMGALGRLFQENLVEGPRTAGGSSPAAASGRATPESPPTTGGGGGGGTGPSSARSRMWGLFGVDEDGLQRQQQQQGHLNPNPRSASSSSINFGGSWSRNMREDEGSEPQTPVSEELRQGRFATLGGGGGGGGDRLSSGPLTEGQDDAHRQSLQSQLNAPRAQRQRRLLDPSTTVDPYSVNDEEPMAGGVRTPDDDGSDFESTSPSQATVAGGRPRFSDLSGFLPSFLSDHSLSTPANTTTRVPSGGGGGRGHNADSSRVETGDRGDEMNDEEAAMASAQIERAHLTAGVETLKSIFPDMESSVCRLVLEGCQGDVQASIDKLLEMS